MSTQSWRMTVYDLAPASRWTVAPGGHAFVYAAGGDLTIAGSSVAAGEGAFAVAGDMIASSHPAWVYEVAPGTAAVRQETGLSPLLSRIVVVPAGDHMIRADRVESQAGAQTPAHRHRGPGIRRLERGQLLANVGDCIDRIDAGQAWFETGHETVVGFNTSGGVNAFVRVMLLPVELAGGKSSFIAATPEDAAKPRAANLRLFGEHMI
jgi:hypothetical protein